MPILWIRLAEDGYGRGGIGLWSAWRGGRIS
jgi:hypothetical protein